MRNLRDAVRTVRFAPFNTGYGASWTLRLFDDGRYVGDGREYIGYELRQHENGITTVLFEGDDFSPSPLDDPFSDEAVLSLIGFLTACPGDVDPDYWSMRATSTARRCAGSATNRGDPLDAMTELC